MEKLMPIDPGSYIAQNHAIQTSMSKWIKETHDQFDKLSKCKFIKVTSDSFFEITYTISYKCPFTRLMQRLS